MKTRTALLLLLALVLAAAGGVALVWPDGLGKEEPADPSAIRVACIGDSITFGMGLKDRAKESYPAQLQQLLGPKYAVRNFGANKATLLKNGEHSYWRQKAFARAREFAPHIVVILLGTNDSSPANWKHKDQFLADAQELVREFADLPSKPKVYLCKPAPAFPGDWGISDQIIRSEVAPRLEQAAKQSGAGVIDLYSVLAGKAELFPDKVHPHPGGAKLIAEEVARVLTRPIVGAIRWDAWTGGEITAQVERTLAPQKYHHRLPWFAQVEGDGKVRIDGSAQEIMDQEIAFAADAGLDYWAFLLYPQSNSMSAALKQYLKSTRRKQINFCVILHNSFGVSDDRWPAERDRAVGLLKEPGYQRVLDDRPLVYAFAVGDHGAGAKRIQEFLQAAQAAGLKPYMVYMGWNPANDFREQSANFDAVSAYAHPGGQKSFAELVVSLEQGPWQNAVKSKAPYVPLVTTGWDKQPRKDHPVSWEKDHAYHQQKVFPSTATPPEIAEHLETGLRFVRRNPDICAANAIIIYAWNEFDEGGWLAPTWSGGAKPNSERLDAIRQVLRGTTGTKE